MTDEPAGLLNPFETNLSANSFTPVTLDDVMTATIEPPRFVIESIVPRNHITLLGAHGGAGKSALALSWAVHTAAGIGWGGLTVERCKVLFVSLEDGAELLRFRLRKMYEYLDREPDSRLTLIDGSRSDGTLAIERSEGGTSKLVMTPVWSDLQEIATGYDLIVIDNASDAYGGNENVRRQVRYFLRNLSQMALINNAAVLLLAHVDKLGARHGSMDNTYSGSTAWHNTARSRLALVNAEDQLQLVHEKSNLGPRIEPMPLEWDGPVLVPAFRDRVAEKVIAEKRSESDANSVLTVIKIAIDSGDDVTTATAGSATTFRALEPYPELPNELRTRDGRKRFWAALKLLQRDKRIRKSEYKNAQRKTKERFELAQSAPVEAEKKCADISPLYPLPELAQSGDTRATSDSCSTSGTGATGANECLRCAGEGCDWCNKSGET